MAKHKHRPCPCGCGEMADECMNPSNPNPFGAFSIGEALDAFDRWQYVQREAERDERPVPDALDEYAALLTSTAHPPNECGDPYDCPAHGEQFRSYHSCKDGRS